MSKSIISSDKAPQAIGSYSVAVNTGSFIFVSGQLGLDPQSGSLVPGGIEAETRQELTNLQHVLSAAGAGLDKVVKTTVFLKDMNDFPSMNAIYGEFFSSDAPARSTIEVAALPKNGLVEIEAIALAE